MQVFIAVLSLVACASATVPVQSAFGYHERVAIPMAKKVKAAEDAIIATTRNSRIVGGGDAAPNSHPYVAGLVITYVNRTELGVCGAALVSRTRLITAAKCWYDGVVQARRFVVVLGSQYLFSGGVRTTSKSVVTAPGWDPLTQQNNLAIILLNAPVILTNKIQPIRLATNPDETYTGQWAVATGFGITGDAQTTVSVFSVVHEVRVQVISVDECRAAYGDMAQPNTLCTSGAGGVGTCLGDGGGPLVTIGESPKLIAVTTFGAAVGCEHGFPSGYSRITSYLDFIAKFL